MTQHTARQEQNLNRWLSTQGLPFFLLLCAVLYLWGLQRNLPYTPEIDEPIFATRAIRMAASGDWNPAWFGNPGSTLLYPLAIIYRIWFALVHQGHLLQPDPQLQLFFDQNNLEFYLLGRLLSVFYLLMAVPLLYFTGKFAFNKQVGFWGTLFFLCCAVVPAHVQTIRTDGAGVFFTVLALFSIVRLEKKPVFARYALAGISVGLAIATRYFLVALLPVLLFTFLWIALNRKPEEKISRLLLYAGGGLSLVGLAFFLSTPYLFLDFSTAQQNILFEARSTQLGQDGFGFFGNLYWYLTTAFPQDGRWPLHLASIFGLMLALRRPTPPRLILILFLLIFLLGISLSPLHWERWLIQLLPVWGLLAAFGLQELSSGIQKRQKLPPVRLRMLSLLLFLGPLLMPLSQTLLTNARHASPTTRVLARHWMVENLPPGPVVQEKATVPLDRTDFPTTEQVLAGAGVTPADYVQAFDYLITKDRTYSNYFAEPTRYAEQIRFYTTLQQDYALLHEFSPSLLRGGPTIRVYALKP
jgi:hypothetical protein